MEKRSKQKIVHDSNPFSTAISGLKKLFEFNMGSLISVNLFNILLYVIIGFTVFVIFVAIIAFIVNNTSVFPVSFYSAYPDIVNYIHSINNVTIFTAWGIGAIVIILLGTLAQATQVKLAIESVKSETMKLGAIVKASFKRIPALIGLMLIPMVASVAVGLVMLVIFNLPQPLNLFAIVVIPIIVIAAIYIGIRLVFATLLIIDESIGPIKAIQRSWEITGKHIGEIIGIFAASALMISMPITLLQSLIVGANGPLINILQLLIGLASLISASLIMTAISERFAQLRNAHDNNIDTGKTHNMNYLAVVFLLIASALTSSITNSIQPQRNPFNSNFNKDFNDLNIEFEDSKLKIN